MIPIDFLAQPTHENMRILCLIWVALFALLLWHQWQNKRAIRPPAGVCAVGLSLIHLGGGFAYCFDQYAPRSEYLLQGGNSLKYTHAGFWMSTLGFGCFVIGVVVCPLVFSRDPTTKFDVKHPQLTTKLPGTLLLLSFAFFFVIFPILRKVPSGASLGLGGAFLSVVAIFIFCHQAYSSGQLHRFRLWLVSTVGFPLLTVLTAGFMSYGIASMIAVWALTLHFYRPRWLSLVLMVAILYFGLTVFVNWMMFRDYIRESVWMKHSMKTAWNVWSTRASILRSSHPIHRVTSNGWISASIKMILWAKPWPIPDEAPRLRGVRPYGLQ